MTEKELRAMPPLNIPVGRLKIEEDKAGILKIFDTFRNKFVILTPEEWVRQNFANWLVEAHGYPRSLMANEYEIKLNGTRKRCDTVVFGRQCEPIIIVEYKAPDVEITQNVFDQIVRYNLELKAKYLIVSNGLRHFCCVMDYKNNSYNFIPVIPGYDQAAGMPAEN